MAEAPLHVVAVGTLAHKAAGVSLQPHQLSVLSGPVQASARHIQSLLEALEGHQVLGGASVALPVAGVAGDQPFGEVQRPLLLF